MAEPTRDAPAGPRARNTIWISCKLPHGLDLFLEDPGHAEQNREPIYIPRQESRLHLNGSNSSSIIGGYGVTEIPLDYWEEWLSKHKRFGPVLSGAIKAQPTRDRIAAQAIDEAKLKSGFEPIDPAHPGDGIDSRGVKIVAVPESDLKAAAAFGSGA